MFWVYTWKEVGVLSVILAHYDLAVGVEVDHWLSDSLVIPIITAFKLVTRSVLAYLTANVNWRCKLLIPLTFPTLLAHSSIRPIPAISSATSTSWLLASLFNNKTASELPIRVLLRCLVQWCTFCRSRIQAACNKLRAWIDQFSVSSES